MHIILRVFLAWLGPLSPNSSLISRKWGAAMFFLHVQIAAVAQEGSPVTDAPSAPNLCVLKIEKMLCII